MTVKEVTNILEQWAPLPHAEDFDNVGLLVGKRSTEVTNVLVAHDALENVVKEAIRQNCNLIVCFHPIIFSGLKKLTGTSYVERAVMKAIKHDIAIYAMHTALDNCPTGVNYGMIKALGLHNSRILIPKTDTIYKLVTYAPKNAAQTVREALLKAGAGSMGNYEQCSFNTDGEGTFKANKHASPHVGTHEQLHIEQETQIHVTFEKHLESIVINTLLNTHPYEEVAYEVSTLHNTHPHLGMGMVGNLEQEMNEKDFLIFTKDIFKTGGIRHSKMLDKPVKKVAVLGGSGAFATAAAMAAGADVLVTADLKYHDYYKAEGRILLIDVGHYESERFTKNLIADYLTEKIRNFAVILSQENTNPINYF